MGAMLEPTDAMGPWHVEVRRESAYLYGADPYWRPGDGPAPDHTMRVAKGVGFAVPVADRDMVIAALGQITAYPTYRFRAAAHAPDEDCWAVETVDGWIRLHGPVIVFGSSEPWRIGGCVELEYRHIPALSAVLGAYGDTIEWHIPLPPERHLYS